MSKQEIIEILKHFYELDLDNCVMSHEQWINEVAEAATEPDYINKKIKEHKEYLAERNQ